MLSYMSSLDFRRLSHFHCFCIVCWLIFDNIHIPPPLPEAMPPSPQALRTAQGPMAAAVAHCSADAPPQRPRPHINVTTLCSLFALLVRPSLLFNQSIRVFRWGFPTLAARARTVPRAILKPTLLTQGQASSPPKARTPRRRTDQPRKA